MAAINPKTFEQALGMFTLSTSEVFGAKILTINFKFQVQNRIEKKYLNESWRIKTVKKIASTFSNKLGPFLYFSLSIETILLFLDGEAITK